MALNEIRKWLRLICFKCGHPIIDDSNYIKIPKAKRLDEASRIAKGTNKQCIICKEIHPLIKKDQTEPLAISAEFYDEKRLVDKYRIYPHKIAEVLSRVSDTTVVLLGKKITSHPRNFVLGAIKAPPVTIRPDVKKMGGGRSTNDDLTTMLQIIIKKNDVMPTVIPATIDLKLEKSIYELNNTYFELVKAGGDGSMNSLALRLKGKAGRFRKNALGKRVRNMCRSTITGDPSIKLDEVGMPLTFARTVQIEETVQEYNKRRLLSYVQNGSKKYPGASKIIKKGTGKEYSVTGGIDETIRFNAITGGAEFAIDGARDIVLENGDKILRDVINGDPVGFNRQPSLMLSNISTMKANVTLDPEIKTLRMNVAVTPLFNADFDGDLTSSAKRA
jgi:DNA-directed RNA polymerase beta' subunit